MACCKVPIKINGFSGGCTKILNAGTEIQFANIAPGFTISGFDISNLAYLGLKCVNIACPPTLMIMGDDLGGVANFLDANLSQINTYRSSTLGDLTAGATFVTTALKAGIASLIAGCGTCCS